MEQWYQLSVRGVLGGRGAAIQAAGLGSQLAGLVCHHLHCPVTPGCGQLIYHLLTETSSPGRGSYTLWCHAVKCIRCTSARTLSSRNPCIMLQFLSSKVRYNVSGQERTTSARTVHIYQRDVMTSQYCRGRSRSELGEDLALHFLHSPFLEPCTSPLRQDSCRELASIWLLCPFLAGSWARHDQSIKETECTSQTVLYSEGECTACFI